MKTDYKTFCTTCYAIFAASAVVQMNIFIVVAAGLAVLGTVVALYSRRPLAAETIYESHMTWLIRTFWIGGAVYMPVITVIASVVILSQMDFNALTQRMLDGGISNPVEMQMMLMTEYGELFRWVAIGCTLPFLCWWLWRCWRGYAFLRKDMAVEKPLGWF